MVLLALHASDCSSTHRVKFDPKDSDAPVYAASPIDTCLDEKFATLVDSTVVAGAETVTVPIGTVLSRLFAGANGVCSTSFSYISSDIDVDAEPVKVSNFLGLIAGPAGLGTMGVMALVTDLYTVKYDLQGTLNGGPNGPQLVTARARAGGDDSMATIREAAEVAALQLRDRVAAALRGEPIPIDTPEPIPTPRPTRAGKSDRPSPR